ncbi:hypothetical protein C1646_677806 [Rhizophagus diaphanus]|nr:hypothetical protein C1646_677806 [Rhizophagus diaphanus] [Rhizophagus sp. MUCL 43196]
MNKLYPEHNKVQGNAHNAFAININKNKTISELKSLIQKEKHNDFAGIDSDQLKLWQVEIPDNCYDELTNSQLLGNNELLATKKISKYFTKNPADEHIHIIVTLPETTKTRKELELINKVAELQKLLKKSINVVIIYGDEDMEDRVKKVLGHIVWLLEEVQRLDKLEDKNI